MDITYDLVGEAVPAIHTNEVEKFYIMINDDTNYNTVWSKLSNSMGQRGV